MRLFGLEITRAQTKAAVSASDLSPTFNSGPWFPLMEPFAGAWQRGVVDTSHKNLFQFSPLFRCVTLIASDVAKLGVRLVELTDGIWQETSSPAFSPVLRKPNRYQTWIQFAESWMLSKLTTGNVFVLKVRDNRGVVVALYALDPHRVTPLVAPGAAVFYKLASDNLSTVGDAVTVPASEIIHDRMNTLYHPLVGVPPIAAAGLAGALGVEMQKQSATFFKNGARPGGYLTAPAGIGKETADRLKTQWEQNYGGENYGKTAVLGDGLKYETIAMTAIDAQLVEGLKLSGEMVCHAFGVPLFKVGLGQMPANSNVAVLNQIYYSDCLQKLIEDFEWSLDDGLALPMNYGVELIIDNLLRMDAQSQMSTLKEGVSAGIIAPNEGRKKVGLRPVKGGESPYLQQQNWSLADLANRSAIAELNDAPSSAPPADDADKAMPAADMATAASALLAKELGLAA